MATEVTGNGVKGSMFKMKLPLNLLAPVFIRLIALVLMFGARKYAKNNWRAGMSWETVLEGVKRHIMAFEEGEERDEESGLPHLAHAACGLMFLCEFAYGPRRQEYRKLDDRSWKENKEEDFAFMKSEEKRINDIDFSKIKVGTK